MVAALPDVFILIDGLDEAPSNSSSSHRKDVLSMIRQFSGRARVCISSRVDDEISTAFKAFGNTVEIDLNESDSHDADISAYIHRLVERDPKLKKLPRHLKDDVVYKLSNRANGMSASLFPASMTVS